VTGDRIASGAEKDEIGPLRARVAELKAALAECRAEQDSCRRFVADAAHQLRTPLTGIHASAEALLRGAPPPVRDSLLANVVRETSRSAQLISDLLKLARLDEGERLQPAALDLVALCRDEISRAWSLAPQLNVVLRSPALDWRVDADDHAVREILANLLDNARRHARSEIAVVLHPADESVEVRVADDGPGVAADMVERIFQRFVTLDGLGGSGLGLAIARDLARAHGGDLGYQEGAFVLRLPVDEENI
jgi:signal transduction histidine kinase